MRQLEVNALVPAVLDIARTAGNRILDIYGTSQVDVRSKEDLSPVTEADLASHDCLVRGLQGLGMGWPVVSEEDTASLPHRRADGCYWLLDPLDGTKEFIGRNGEFTVNIALIDNGSPMLGVVAAPALGLVYWGAPGVGAYRVSSAGTAAIRVAPPLEGGRRPLRVVASRSHMDEATQAFIGRLGPVELVQAGSSLKFCMVAEGAADLYPRFAPTCEWDTAAAQAVLEAAGGCVVAWDGAPLRYGKPEVLNASFIAAASAQIIGRH